jgi:hypothetical protein
MEKEQTGQPQALRIATEGPIVLAGQPRTLRGDLYLQNQGEERVRLHRLPLALTGKSAAALSAARPGAGPAVRLSPGLLRPGHSGPVSLSISLDPHTPPGEYHAEVEIAGQAREVVMHVTERVALRISPNPVVLENRPQESAFRRIVVSNLGNVPLTVGKFGAIFLDDDLLVCRSLRHAAASVGDDLRPLEEYLARILLSAKQVAESSGILRVYNRSGEVTIQPGEVQPVDLEIRIPPDLDRRGRFRGVYALYTANLSFVIVPTAGPVLVEDETPPPKPRRRRGKNEEANQS